MMSPPRPFASDLVDFEEMLDNAKISHWHGLGDDKHTLVVVSPYTGSRYVYFKFDVHGGLMTVDVEGNR